MDKILLLILVTITAYGALLQSIQFFCRRSRHKPLREVHFPLHFRIGFHVEGINGEKMNQDTILDNQQATAQISATDSQGQPVNFTFDSAPTWGSLPATGMTLTPSADGLSCLCVPSAVGSFSISLSGQVGGQPVSATGTLNVTPGAAVNFTMSFGAASAQTPAAPAAPATPVSGS